MAIIFLAKRLEEYLNERLNCMFNYKRNIMDVVTKPK